MALKIRLSRGGAKKRPMYRIVVADSRSPRDGRFIERLGLYQPMLAKDNPERLTMDTDRVKYWLERGATPSDRVAVFLGSADILPMPVRTKGLGKQKVREAEAAKAAAEAEAAAKEAAEAEAAKAAEEAAAAAEAPAEEPAAEEPAAEEAPAADEVPAEETADDGAEKPAG
jgi:small subunit ribosomal protein S16